MSEILMMRIVVDSLGMMLILLIISLRASQVFKDNILRVEILTGRR